MKQACRDGMIQIAPNGWANEAGVRWLEHHRKHHRPLPNDACLQGPSWTCPHAPNPPCTFHALKKASSRKKCAFVLYSERVRELEPVGQMTLDAPAATHKAVWKHPEVARWSNEGAYPGWDGAVECCKEKAADMVLYLQALFPLITRIVIRPMVADAAWLAEQQATHEGRVKPCVFDDR